MDLQHLTDTAQALVASPRGLLAMDESVATCNQRFAAVGVAQTVALRHAWRELLLTAPGLSHFISGVILHDETFHQTQADGTPFVAVARAAGLQVGIKVDLGAKPLALHPGEKVTEGLDGLRERLQAYAAQGAVFAKWRAVISLGDSAQPGAGPRDLPSPACLDANAHALARYAALCQEAGLVPVIEPELLMDGSHTLDRCQAVTEEMLRRVFAQLTRQGVVLEALILKTHLVTPGLACTQPCSPADVSRATWQCLLRAVPAAVPGIAFLSGGQAGELASSRLNALHAEPRLQGSPWALSFSFARALQHPALGIWGGLDAHRAAAQAALLHRAQCNSAALSGRYTAAMEGA